MPHCRGKLCAFHARHGILWTYPALGHPRSWASLLFFPHCRAQQRHLPIYLPADALQVIHAHLESADLSEGEAAMQTPGSGEEAPSQKMQVLIDPVPRILACDKSLVQPVWLGADSLPWLRAATAGTSSSVVLCKSCKEQVSCAAGASPKISTKFMPHVLPVNTKALEKSMPNSCAQKWDTHLDPFWQ